jgi:valyl-tRNA synthetase
MELPTRYTPAEHEGAIYAKWEASGAFTPGPPKHGERTFTVMIPPPNVTGVLHMGHALNNTIQDIVVRHRRMSGWTALWVPGTDHAGIATQAVVERKLFEEEKKTRNDLGREAFLERVWAWKEKHGNYILEQFRRMGFSCDWTRTHFTMEPALSRAVRVAFVRLFEKGLVYRGPRLVNWDCVLETAVGDDEIEYQTRKDKLYHIRYPVRGGGGPGDEGTGEFVTVAGNLSTARSSSCRSSAARSRSSSTRASSASSARGPSRSLPATTRPTTSAARSTSSRSSTSTRRTAA